MKVVYDDLNSRMSEIDGYIKFVWAIDLAERVDKLEQFKNKKIQSTNKKNAKYTFGHLLKNNYFEITPDLRKTLRASCFLLLYNVVESTVVNALNHYFESFSKENLTYIQVKNELKRIWVSYNYSGLKKFNKRVGEKDDEYIVRIITDIAADIISIAPKDTNYYKGYLEKINKAEISGNLDARQIRSILTIYGIIPPHDDGCDNLLIIKNKRNSLAHGEEAFIEVGKGYTIEDIMLYKDEIQIYLNKILAQFEKHISKKKFKIK